MRRIKRFLNFDVWTLRRLKRCVSIQASSSGTVESWCHGKTLYILCTSNYLVMYLSHPHNKLLCIARMHFAPASLTERKHVCQSERKMWMVKTCHVKVLAAGVLQDVCSNSFWVLLFQADTFLLSICWHLHVLLSTLLNICMIVQFFYDQQFSL